VKAGKNKLCEIMEAYRNEATGRWTLEGVEPSEVTFDGICKMLRKGENFKFARYGDGEGNCMIGKIGHNCDGHEYFPDLGMALNNAFYSYPQYMVGIQPLMVQQGTWNKLISQREGYPKNIYDADALHSASIDGKLSQFFDSLKDRHTILVGPGHLMKMNFTDHVLIPNLNCWKDYDNILFRLDRALSVALNPVVLLCASMMSEVLIDDFSEEDITMIDCGSVFDPLTGKLSRRYHHKLNLNGH
jgi:hypothetical protein